MRTLVGTAALTTAAVGRSTIPSAGALKPWGASERDEWRTSRKVVRSYREEVLTKHNVQMLVEEVFYIYDAAWCDIFWEVQNRELVRRLLNAFPVMSWAKSEVRVRPSELLPIARTSTVEWAQKDVPRLGPGTGEFSRLLPDACWYGSATGAFNVGAPRCVLPALSDAWTALQADVVHWLS